MVKNLLLVIKLVIVLFMKVSKKENNMSKKEAEKLIDCIQKNNNVKAHEILKKMLVDKATKRIASVLSK